MIGSSNFSRTAGAQHGMCELGRHGTAGARHGMCELALMKPCLGDLCPHGMAHAQIADIKTS